MLYSLKEIRKSHPRKGMAAELTFDCRYRITPTEVCLYIWFAAFAYDEVCEFFDAGSIFYAIDIWNGCDVIIILIGAAFLITSEY